MSERKTPAKNNAARIIQSFSFAKTPRSVNSVYEERLLVALAHYAYMENDLGMTDFSHKRIGDADIYNLDGRFWNIREVVLPVSTILKPGDRSNYHHVHYAFNPNEDPRLSEDQLIGDGLRGLTNITIIYTGSNGKRGCYTPFPRIEFDGKGYMRVHIYEDFWKELMKVGNGYTRYNPQAALSLNSPYAIRLYQIISEKKYPVRFSVEEFKKMFTLVKKYDLTKDLVKRILLPTQKELDRKCNWSFDLGFEYETGKKGRPAIKEFILTPRKVKENISDEEEAKSLKSRITWLDLRPETRLILKDTYGFTTDELLRHQDIITELDRKTDIKALITAKRKYIDRSDKPKGYIIHLLQGEYDNLCGRLFEAIPDEQQREH